MDFLKDIVKEIGGEYTQLASEIDETETYVDTGSYIFNALVSGSIFGGVSGNKITAIAGETSTGKTFFSLAVVKNFLDNNPTGYCLYFDTEAAITKSLLESRGVDTNRLVVVNVVTVEEFLRPTQVYFGFDWMENRTYNKSRFIFYLMNLPINEKELDTIISAMRLGGDSALYQKLWSYKMNNLIKEKKENE